MRSVTRTLFSLHSVSGGLEADGLHEFVQIIDHALIQPIESRVLLLLQLAVAGESSIIQQVSPTAKYFVTKIARA